MSWALRRPSRPQNLPENATWVASLSTPLNFTPQGYWVGCKMTGKMLEDNAVARCMVTDYKGIVSTEDDYVVVNRVPLTPYVVIQAKGLSFVPDHAHNRVIDTIEMMDGGQLAPVSYAAAAKDYYRTHGLSETFRSKE
jgi:hypothetical protein